MKTTPTEKVTIVFLGDADTSHLLRWTRYFAAKGHEVHVISWNPPVCKNFPIEADQYKPAILHSINKVIKKSNFFARIINVVNIFFATKKLIKQIKPDLIHAMSAGSYAWMAMLVNFHPYIVSPWWGEIISGFKTDRIDRYLSTKSILKADLIHSDGYKLSDELHKLGVDPQKIVFVTYGVNLDLFTFEKKNDRLLAKHNLANKKVIISTRLLTSIHGVDTLIRAIPAVIKARPEAKFLIIGKGHEEEKCKNLVRDFGIQDSVIFLGSVTETEMADYLLLSDIYVSTSHYECGIAASTAEAMACGLPVINTDTGDISSWLTNGQENYIIPAGDEKILVEKIIRLLSDENEMTRYRQQNRSIIEERNNFIVEMKKMESIYYSLTSWQHN